MLGKYQKDFLSFSPALPCKFNIAVRTSGSQTLRSVLSSRLFNPKQTQKYRTYCHTSLIGRSSVPIVAATSAIVSSSAVSVSVPAVSATVPITISIAVPVPVPVSPVAIPVAISPVAVPVPVSAVAIAVGAGPHLAAVKVVLAVIAAATVEAVATVITTVI